MEALSCYDSQGTPLLPSPLPDKIRPVLFTPVLWSFIAFSMAYAIHLTEHVIALWR